jgi:hypothetical protein
MERRLAAIRIRQRATERGLLKRIAVAPGIGAPAE